MINLTVVYTEIMDKVGEILKFGVICDHCLGRQFGKLISGLSNDQRGKAIRIVFAMQIDSMEDMKGIDASNFSGIMFHGDKLSMQKLQVTKKCVVCDDFFKSIDKWASKAVSVAKGTEFGTFLVGTSLSSELLSHEENLWESAGVDHCEPLKAEINREMGKRIEKILNVKADLKNPDVNFIIDTSKKKIYLQRNPAFFYGEYQKLVRGIPQTKWPSGKYITSIEQIVAAPLMKDMKGTGHKLHGMGREDIDARCLGWRPFVIEILEPLKRKVELKKIMLSVNKGNKVKVRNMRISGIVEVRKIKDSRAEKEYRVEVFCERKVSKSEITKLKSLIGEIKQQTPIRVIKRRADLMRKRKVISLRATRVSQKKFILTVRGDAGLYIKELISGDSGRTRPSVSEILGCKCEPKNLDVMKIIS